MKFSVRVFIALFSIITGFVLVFLNLKLKGKLNITPKSSIPLNIDTTSKQISHLVFRNSSYFNRSALLNREVNGQKTILMFNVPAFLVRKLRKDILYGNCEYKNCLFTRKRYMLSHADAVLFYVGIRDEGMGKYPPINNERRNPDQVWIFTATEPPEHYYNTDYMSPNWYNTMNWSCLYRLDSDIPIPYGALIDKGNDNIPDYESIFKMKTKNAIWYVSHCQVASERRLYVNEMIRHGFEIDIFGGCGPDGRKTKTNNTEFEQTIPRYKFYIAFENSLCTDYISEKFFRNYNYNWIIIVRGGADYRRLIPTGTFVNTADFKDTKTLVNFLSVLGNNKRQYIEFLKNKDSFTSLTKPFNRNCDICRRLNNLSNFRKTYYKIGDYLNNGHCRRANDL